jgi:hypothetical protein
MNPSKSRGAVEYRPMRRFAPRLFTFCSAASLALCVLSLALLARGLHVRDYLCWAGDGGHFISVDSIQGCLFVSVIRSDSPQPFQWQRGTAVSQLYP